MRPTGLVLAAIFLVSSASALIPSPSPPYADFVWNPSSPLPGEAITFHSTSYDMDGVIVRHRWVLPGEAEVSQFVFGADVTTNFPHRGIYAVTHEVMDSTLLTSNITRMVTVQGRPPVPAIEMLPSPAHRGELVTFLGSATDPDGDPIAAWEWDLGDGFSSSGQNATHAYTMLGIVSVSLTVLDGSGETAIRVEHLRIVNAPPQITAHFYREDPAANAVVTFDASGIDPDVPSGVVTFSWTFSDGASYDGARVVHHFGQPGEYVVEVRGHDADGGISAPTTLAVRVG